MDRASERTIWTAATLATSMAWAVSAWAAPPALGFEEQAVVITGIAPESRAALFGVSRGFNSFTRYVLRHDEVLTADAAGEARLELELPVAVLSVWAAVNLDTGEIGIGAPPASEVHRIALSRDAVDSDGRSVTEQGRLWADLLWVRPGEEDGSGVWGARFRDGGSSDRDGAEDRSIRAEVTAFLPVEEGEALPPERLVSGDVVVLVDPDTLEIAASRLSERGLIPLEH